MIRHVYVSLLRHCDSSRDLLLLECFVTNFIWIRTRILFSFLKHVFKYHVQRLRFFCCTVSLRCLNVHLSFYNFCIQSLFFAYNLAPVYEWGDGHWVCLLFILFCIIHLGHRFKSALRVGGIDIGPTTV